jgi:hypothetical protein
MGYTVPNTFATQSGNVPASQLDGNFTALLLGVNNTFLVGTIAARPAPDGVGNGRYYFATDASGGTLYRDNGASWVQVAGAVTPATPVLRNYIAGLNMSTAGGSTTITIAAGIAVDATNVDTLVLAASMNKTTAAWVAGGGNGGLDTGAIAASTWYHFWLIKRTDTGIVDVLFSLSETAPTMPANYTEKRYIGSWPTDGASKWAAWTQDGDMFTVQTPISGGDVTWNTGGSSAVSRTLVNVPLGVDVLVYFQISCTNGGSAQTLYISDLDSADVAPTLSSNTLATLYNKANVTDFANGFVRTNTSQQIRSRESAGAADDTVRIWVLYYINTRGKDA